MSENGTQCTSNSANGASSAKGIHTAVEAAVHLGTLIEVHAGDAGRQLGEWLRPWLREGEVLPDLSLALQLPARMIVRTGHRLRENQARLAESGSHEAEVQVLRDHSASVLHRKLVETRQLLTAVFGPRRTATLLDFQGKTAKASQSGLLMSQAEAVLKVLRDPKRLAIPDTCSLDPVSAAAALESLLVAYRGAFAQLDEIRQAKAARRESRDRVQTELARGVPCVVGILSGWLGLIGRADLVEKLGLLRRREKTKNAKDDKNAKDRS